MPRATKLTRLNFLLSSLVYFYHHQLLSSKKDQKLRKNNGVNNTRKNLTFLTVLGLSKKNEKKEKKSKKKNQNVTSYPLNTTLVLPPMNMHVFNCFSLNFIWEISTEIEFSTFTHF